MSTVLGLNAQKIFHFLLLFVHLTQTTKIHIDRRTHEQMEKQKKTGQTKTTNTEES